MYFGICQRHTVDGVTDMAQLGRRRLEKFPPRRRVKENVFDLDCRSQRGCSGGNLVLPSPIHAQSISPRRARRPGNNFHPSDRADARQSLAAKTQGRNTKQILIVFELAGGVALHRKGEVFRRHTAAVVGHADECAAALFDPDGNLGRARIERILDQLLDHRRRPFDNFARGDTARHFIGQDLNLQSGRTPCFDNNAAKIVGSRKGWRQNCVASAF